MRCTTCARHGWFGSFAMCSAWSGSIGALTENNRRSPALKTSARIAFRNLSLKENTCERVVLSRFEQDGRYVARALRADSLRFAGTRQTQGFRLRILDGRFYSGKLRGEMRSDFKRFAWEWRLAIHGAALPALAGHVPAVGALRGRLWLSGVLSGQAHEAPRLALRFKILDGSFGPQPSLSRWTEETGIESLRLIRFDRLTGTAQYGEKIWELEDLRLSGPSLRFGADLTVHEKYLHGRLTAQFPAEDVKRSSDLAWLMRFVGQRSWVDFDFEVAGALPRWYFHSGD